MSSSKESYIIYGCKFEEDFTTNYWEEDFRDEMEWDIHKASTPSFITDGMNGDYTFFGFIVKLSGRDYYDDEIKEIDLIYNKEEIIYKFKELYPDMEIPEIKLYYLPHYT